MRCLFLIFGAILAIMTGCRHEEMPSNEQPDPSWNGYFDYYKMGEVTHTLWAYGMIDVGTVIYGINNNAEFYVTINIDSISGWKLYKSHMFAGEKLHMPRNRARNYLLWRNYQRFSHTSNHPEGSFSHTYTVPLSNLPPAEQPGFVVATHALVKQESRCNYFRHAWAEGDYKFGCKGFGWYDVYYFNQENNQFITLYATEYSTDSLKVYQVDVTNGSTQKIYTEYIGNQDGIYNGTAYDHQEGDFYFSNYNTQELFKTNMNDSLPSMSTGVLDGLAASATFYDGNFYYVDEVTNNIIKVDFDQEGIISGESVLSTIPSSITVNDIAMSPSGDYLYIMGDVNNGKTELIIWEIIGDAYSTIGVDVDHGTQIAFGADGNLYALEPHNGLGTSTYILNTEMGIINPINEDSIIIVEPFTDMARGPLM